MISLSPLVHLRDFSFGRMFVRVAAGYVFSIKALGFVVHSNTYEFLHYSYRFGDGALTGGGFRLPLTLEIETTSMHWGGWYRYDEVPVIVDEYGGGYRDFINTWNALRLPIFSKIQQLTVSRAAQQIQTLGSVLYDPLPDVLANLDHLGQRLEVWLETELSGGSREWRRLFRSAPAAQVSIGPLQDAGFVDEDGYIVRMPEAGAALPVYGRNALGPYSKIDQFNPSRAS